MVNRRRVRDMLRSHPGCLAISEGLWVGMTGEEPPDWIEEDSGFATDMARCPAKYRTESGVLNCMINVYTNYITEEKDYISRDELKDKIEERVKEVGGGENWLQSVEETFKLVARGAPEILRETLREMKKET